MLAGVLVAAAAAAQQTKLRGTVQLPAELKCHSISPQVTDQWCDSNCNHSPPNCPASLCKCGDGPTPPAPPQPPAPKPSGTVTGFFYAPYASSAAGKAPGSGMAIYFWGNDPQTWYNYYKQSPTAYTAAKLLPGDYALKVLNLGGGGTQWDDAQIAAAAEFAPHIRNDLGYDAICLDTEVMGTFQMSNLLSLFRTAKAAGLITVLTTTAEGPYSGCDSPNDCWKDIKWDDVDYLVPQMYGASGTNYPSAQLLQYAAFWKAGGGQGIHGKFPGPSNLNSILWGINSGTGPGVLKELGFGGGYIDWAYKSL
eukprot:TRINITY_DN762_c0_g1_i2.p1 TRINITY_DN762_c0_g1~~TRINITY_DN762_c0_g1_i2.p1  ORF type:complete len:336 (+),score=125.24 TRINITY_DN762_c0_g1_i2:83-1009(+)